ncbi:MULTISPECIES: DUF4160 domain-containing protein [unclassified Pseudomonas]|jgi:hypothetical protein|uniref:DUF4160 domain-containing protein n=1 Tax=Pseudomonas sp. GV071 TaxID=2135754 RepID=UPI000D3BA567|nr:uncharacterized protein DUF4160 [Pseudomonas sp. GV071]
MATLKSTGTWKIKIYPDDHGPPHFHVQTADGESLVVIATLQETRSGANKRALKDAQVGARHNHATLIRAWHEQNSRTAP